MSVSNIAHFRALVGRVQLASDPQVKLALLRLAAESKERLCDSSRQTTEFFEALRSALSQLKGNANVEIRFNCFYDCARHFYVRGDVLKSISAARAGLALARSASNSRLARKGYTSLGVCLADSGAVGEAIECQVAAIDLARKTSDVDGLAASTINLGTALSYASQYEDAIACFDLADTEMRNQSSARDIRVRILSNKAYCYLRLGQIEAGLRCSQLAIAAAGEPKTATELFDRIVRESNYIQLLLEAGMSVWPRST
jgi:tetratricopeptide (TPR) repeat protein